MTAISKILTSGVGIAALVGAAAPAAAQYPGYPGYGYGSGGGLGAVIESILGGQRYAYGADNSMLVNQCVAAVTNQIERSYAYNRYGPYGQGAYGAYGYGYAGSNARVLGITDVDRRSNRLRVRGIATANAQAAPYGYDRRYDNRYGNYGRYGYAQPTAELSFKCDIDYRGRIRDIDLDRNNRYAYPYRR